MNEACRPSVQQQKPNRRKGTIINFSLLVGSLIFSLLLCELTLRVFYPGHSPFFLDIYELDADGILMLKPNIERRHLTSEWNVTITTNSQGLRDRERPVSRKNGTVLGVGDSMSFGWGVELPQTYHFLIEERLRPDEIQVVKAGIPATGTSDQSAWLRHYGERHQPSLVMLSFYVGNDFVDVQMGGVRNQFIVRDGWMVKKSLAGGMETARFRDIIENVKQSSLLAQKVAEAVWYFENSRPVQDRSNPGLAARDQWLWEFGKIHLKYLPPETVRAFDLTLVALDEINQWCQQRGIPLVLTVIPRSFQIYDWELANWKEAYRVKDADLDLDRPQRVLAEWASKRGVMIVDLLPPFRNYQAQHPAERLYFYPNGHLNANGHRLIAVLVTEHLKTVLRKKLGHMEFAPERLIQGYFRPATTKK